MAVWTKAGLCGKSSLLEQSLPRTPSRLRIICVNPVNLVKKTSCLSVFVAKNPRNLRNPRLINDLRVYKALYNCRETITDVMESLQINPFMQNKANFRKSQMNVTKVLTKDYEKWTLGEHGKNKPKTNPKQTQTKPIKANLLNAQMNVTVFYTKDYENMSNWAICENKPNSNPIKPNFPAPPEVSQSISVTVPPLGNQYENTSFSQ